MTNDLPVKSETLTEQLEREKARLYKFIADEEKAIERAKKNIHWDRKRLKLVESQLSELNSSASDLKEITKNLK